MFSNWESGGHVIHECHVEDPTNKYERLILQYKRTIGKSKFRKLNLSLNI